MHGQTTLKLPLLIKLRISIHTKIQKESYSTEYKTFSLTSDVSKNGQNPNYANIKIPHTTQAARCTKMKAQKQRLKHELEFDFIKIQNFNQEPFKLHLNLANKWGNLY